MLTTKVAVIGAGPAGIGASLLLKEQGIDFILINKGMPGGKVNIAPRVDNYPGFSKIPGPELAMAIYKRLLDKGIEILPSAVTSLTKNDNNQFNIVTDNNEIINAKFVIICTGTNERKAGLDNEDKLLGHGISYCAVCDGHFFKNKDVLVIGGGNSALKESIYLADIASHVTLIHRRNEFRGTLHIVNELKEKKNVTILTPYIPIKIIGEDHVEGIVIQNKETLELKKVKCDGIFPLIGQIPNTDFIKIPNVLNEYGNIPCDKQNETSCKNLFACGDTLPRELRQIYLSEFDGKNAAKEIIKRIKEE